MAVSQSQSQDALPVWIVGAGGAAAAAGTAADPVNSTPAPLTAGTNRSGTATTTSGVLFVASNAARKGLVGQNIGANNVGFHEHGGTAAIGTAGTYTVPPGSSFSISTANRINFIAATGDTAVTMTEY